MAQKKKIFFDILRFFFLPLPILKMSQFLTRDDDEESFFSKEQIEKYENDFSFIDDFILKINNEDLKKFFLLLKETQKASQLQKNIFYYVFQDLCLVLDSEIGDKTSVVDKFYNKNKNNDNSKQKLDKFGILKTVSLREHSINVGNIILDLLKKETKKDIVFFILKYLITALGHDIIKGVSSIDKYDHNTHAKLSADYIRFLFLKNITFDSSFKDWNGDFFQDSDNYTDIIEQNTEKIDDKLLATEKEIFYAISNHHTFKIEMSNKKEETLLEKTLKKADKMAREKEVKQFLEEKDKEKIRRKSETAKTYKPQQEQKKDTTETIEKEQELSQNYSLDNFEWISKTDLLKSLSEFVNTNVSSSKRFNSKACFSYKNTVFITKLILLQCLNKQAQEKELDFFHLFRGGLSTAQDEFLLKLKNNFFTDEINHKFISEKFYFSKILIQFESNKEKMTQGYYIPLFLSHFPPNCVQEINNRFNNNNFLQDIKNVSIGKKQKYENDNQ